jgi:hypothetical protein
MHCMLSTATLVSFMCGLSLQAMEKPEMPSLVLQVFTLNSQGCVEKKASFSENKKRSWSTMATPEFPRLTPGSPSRKARCIGRDEFDKKPCFFLDSHLISQSPAKRTALIDTIEKGITYDPFIALTGKEKLLMHYWCEASRIREKEVIKWTLAESDRMNTLNDAFVKINRGERNASLQALRNARYIHGPAKSNDIL